MTATPAMPVSYIKGTADVFASVSGGTRGCEVVQSHRAATCKGGTLSR